MKLYRIKNRQSFGFSAENPTGQKNGGTKGKDCEKLRPCIQIAPGETVTLCDTDGPGMITHIWFTGYVGHSFVMRIYWENEEFPSVEAPISAFFGCAYDENFKDRDGNYIVLNSAKILTAPGRGFNSYWEMPFEKHCRITMENRSKKEETLAGTVRFRRMQAISMLHIVRSIQLRRDAHIQLLMELKAEAALQV